MWSSTTILEIMSSPFFNYSALFLIDFLALILIFIVLLNKLQKKTNKLFVFTIISFLFWINGGFTFSSIENKSATLILGRIILGEVVWSFILLYFFLRNLLYNGKGNSNLAFSLVFIGLLASSFSIFSGFVVQSIQFTEFGNIPLFGKGSILYYGLISFVIFCSIQLLYKKYSQGSVFERRAILAFFVGLLLFVIFNFIFNIYLPISKSSIYFWQLGNYSSIFLIVFSIYAILRHRFLGVKIFFKKNSFQLALVVMGLSVTTYALMILNRIAQEQLNVPPQISTAVMIALITLSLPVLQFGIKRLLDRFVPREVVDFGRVADLMNESIARSKDVDDVVFRLSKEIEKSLMVDEVTFLVRDEKFQTFVSVYPKQFNVRFEFDHPFIDFMQGIERVFHLFQLFEFMKGHGSAFAEKMNPIYQLLLKRKVAIIAPIGTYTDMVGLVLIPERRNGDQYSPEDLLELERFFTDVRPHLADVLKTGKLDPASASASNPSDVASSIKMDHEIN